VVRLGQVSQIKSNLYQSRLGQSVQVRVGHVMNDTGQAVSGQDKSMSGHIR